MSTRTLRHVAAHGTELAYWVQGQGEPVVLIHGGIVADAFLPLFDEPALSAHYRLIAYHRSGYGASARPAHPVSTEEQAKTCLALMRHLGVDRAHIVGYSYGGTIALQLALEAPEMVHSLALLDPLVPGVELDSAAQQYFGEVVGAAMALYMAGAKEAAVERWALGAFGAEFRPALEHTVPVAFEQAVTDADALFAIDAPALQQWSLHRVTAGRITQPTLLLVNSATYWSGFRATHDQLLDWLPEAEGRVLPVETHLLMMEKPSPVAAALAGFLARHSLAVAAASPA